ncbi:IclR family transcriptional regulator [Alloyangia pacifica]|uniref:Transcriptional regulator, IclR family n=1 Tax=Alloyangia pacifica TaxID=311180 RepID=A0A1I6VGX8_9RHOB|nr:helix-turn-helix domain-containing protein [Alloyangia pacifica]SDH97627.1 transcriptional regulator, IclR family [Alloyangia pacifica]SFT12973.1 transcriptional regulator, IclR family [Alloyangia pacifica]
MSKYVTPALAKGLDILELLTSVGRPMKHAEIADALGRSKSELFRMLVTLQERGYLDREAESDAFMVTDKLFRLGLRVPHVRTLVDCALPALERLTEEIEQSAHLVVQRAGRTVVIASFSGGSDMAFSLKLGFGRVAADSTSGQVIMAFQDVAGRERMLEESLALLDAPPERATVMAKLERIRAQGYEMHESRDFHGISDLSAPILDDTGRAAASVVVAFVNRYGVENQQQAALRALRQSCMAISGELGSPEGILPPI